MTIKSLIRKLTPKFLLSVYHFKLALLGAIVFGFPSRGLVVIGVTGTSGKSTTSDLITRILEEAGNKVASISTIRFKIKDKEWENKYKMTMPGRFVIQKFLRQAKNTGCKYVVLEVTSEGIRQFRHKFINFDAVVFTNLTPEHVESHGSFENYRNEKLKLFRSAKNKHIINIDDKNCEYFLNTPAQEIWACGFKSKINQILNPNVKMIFAENIAANSRIKFFVNDTEFNLNLIGEFNVYNALAAICVGRAYGIDLKVCKTALEKAKGIAGRMEIVSKNPTIIVDYAHTPEQLEGVYKSLNSKHLICVLGSCGGGRDKWKRPALGKIASQYCDKIVITNEDPYDENPMDIIGEVASGIQNPTSNTQHLILDRKEAIKTAVKLANPGDVVIITGKGSEPWMCIENGKKIPWDDRQIVRDALAAKD